MTDLLNWTRVRAFVFLWRRWGPQERATIWESGGTGFCLAFITGTLCGRESGVSPPWSSVLTSVWWTRWSLIFFPAVYTVLRDLDIWWKHRTVYWHWHWQSTLTTVYWLVYMVAQTVKNLPAIKETQVWSLGWEDPLEKGMTTHSNILAWRIPIDRGASWAINCGGAESDMTEQLTLMLKHFLSI